MNYGNKYILAFTNSINEVYEIFFDFLNYIPTTPINLTGTADCLTLRCTAGDQTKFQWLLGTEALIKIAVSANAEISIADLIAQHDNDIRITIYKDKDYTKSWYQGFVVVDKNNQPLFDPPYVLQVRALDGLGLLKGVDLVDSNKLPFNGSMSIVKWIAQILYKTGQTLNLRVYFNIYNSLHLTNASALDQTFINAVTFKKAESPQTSDPSIDINALDEDDCYTALEKIVRNFRCRLFQQDGVWNLVSLYEYLNPKGYSFYEFQILDPVGGIVQTTGVNTGVLLNYDVNIGKNEIIRPLNKDGMIYLLLATKWTKFTYNYDQSQNKVCNQKLTDGLANHTYDGTIPSSVQDPTIKPAVTLTTKGYDLTCWNHYNANSSSVLLPGVAPDKNAYVRGVVDPLGYELDRYIVIETTSVLTWVQSSQVLIDAFDRLEFTFDFRTKILENVILPRTVAYVFLAGDDGTFWALDGSGGDSGAIPAHTSTWRQVNSNYQLPGGVVPSIKWTFKGLGASGTDSTTWSNINCIIPGQELQTKAPVNGTLMFLLAGDSGAPSPAGQESWFKNIAITITPYLQGSYTPVKGDYNYSASNNLIKQTLSEDVQISDSPKRYFKGALLQSDGKSLAPASWSRAGFADAERFTQLQEQIVFNHNNRILQMIEGTFRGFTWVDKNFAVRQAGLLNSYLFSDVANPTKKFMMTSFEKDICRGYGRCVFVETLNDNNDTGFAAPDNFTFNYIFQ